MALLRSYCRAPCLAVFWLFSAALLLAAAPPKAPTFDPDIRTILEKNCLVCHGEAAPQAELDLRTTVSMLKGGKSGPAIVPGSASQSLLMQKLVTKTMPPAGEKLSDDEVDRIRQWIDSGALEHADADANSQVAANAPVVTDQDVLPIFQMRCVVCHGKRRQEGGLDLRTQASRLKGGKSGPALVAGRPEESLIIQKIASGAMPPREMQRGFSVRPPTDAELERLRQWITAGAPQAPEGAVADAGADSVIGKEDKQFWSFQPPKRPAVPRVKHQRLVRNPIDAFLLRKLEEKDLSYSPEAEPLDLLRRAYLDLVGMPPSPEEIQTFLADQRPDRYDRLIDRLLESPHYGEKWGRHWLDLAGYSDSIGFGFDDGIRPYAWRYRDYVIRALNSDKPYSEFLTEQIAGDELFDYTKVEETTQEVIDRLAATGFLRTTPDPTNAPPRAFLAERMNVLVDEVQVLTSSVMGLTMGCARCHDHKFDPIPQRDYYRLSAILQRAYDPYDWLPPRERELPIALESEKKAVEEFNAPLKAEIERLRRALEVQEQPFRERLLNERLEALPEDVRRDLQAVAGTAKDKRTEVQKYLAEKFEAVLTISTDDLTAKYDAFKQTAEPLQKEITDLEKKLKPEPHVRVLMDTGGAPSTAYLLRRGDPLNPGQPVDPGVPAVLSNKLEPYNPAPPWPGSESSGSRLAFARWLTQPNHPLTARVMVNHIWIRHFGRGIVATPENFGRSGMPPSHPELLDWLATEFVRQGWSMKQMHRLMMTSTAYRQTSVTESETLKAADPGNVLLSRMPLRRMTAEELYDSILKATGRLDPTQFGPPEMVEAKPNEEIVPVGSEKGFRRSVYVLQKKSTPVTLLEAFDLPSMTPNCTERPESNVPTQALQLMNSSQIWDHSRYMAGRVLDEVPDSREKQIEQVYLRTLSRPPSPQEIEQGSAALDQFTGIWRAKFDEDSIETPKEWTARWQALAALCQTILNSAEFTFID